MSEPTQLKAFEDTVGDKAQLQNATEIGSQKCNSGPRINSEFASVGDFETFDYQCKASLLNSNSKLQTTRFDCRREVKLLGNGGYPIIVDGKLWFLINLGNGFAV